VQILYETRVLDSSYLQYKVQLPTSDSTEITAGGNKVTLDGPIPLDAPWPKNTFILNASSSSSFRDIRGSQIYTRGPTHPWRPLAGRNFCTLSEYFTISNCVFNFSFLSLVLCKILGALRPWIPLAEKFFIPKMSTLAVGISNCVFNFNFLALVLYEILGGLKFTSGGPAPPGGPIAEKCWHTHKYLPMSI